MTDTQRELGRVNFPHRSTHQDEGSDWGRGEKVIKRACKADRIVTRTPWRWRRLEKQSGNSSSGCWESIDLSKSERSFNDARKWTAG
jgi:hypothetical protein